MKQSRTWSAACTGAVGLGRAALAIPLSGLVRPGQAFIEHCALPGVKEPMDRLRVMCVTLLPVLWMLGVGPSMLEASAPGARLVPGVSVSPSESGKAQGAREAIAFDRLARWMNRRLIKLAGSDSFTPPPALSGSEVGCPARFALGPRVPAGPPGLAQYWQFSLRAALEPRAPSPTS